MSSSSEFAIHHRDIYGYCLALQNFLNVTETKHDRSNSPRAQKARAKLLKLSASQFYELSTDVYDELQRRRSTGHGQPEYLLPKAGFHIKRNQARQKLANLSQTRFNDLVDDILFEIKRRGYDANTESVKEPSRPGFEDDHNSYGKDFGVKNSNQSNENTISTSDGSLVQVPPTAIIQASQVIPKKASIDWSSEEDDEMPAGKLSSKATNGEAQDLGKIVSTSSRKDGSSSSLLNGSNPPTPVLKSFQEDYHYYDLNETPLKSKGQETPQNGRGNAGNSNLIKSLSPARLRVQGAVTSSGDNAGATSKLANHTIGAPVKEPERDKGGELEALRKECERLEAELEKKNTELVALKDENRKLKVSSADSAETGNIVSQTSFQKELTSLSSQVSSLSIDNEKLKQQISELELKAKSVVVNKVDHHDDIQNKYSLELQSISQYVSENGSLPYEMIEATFEQINLLFVKIQSENSDDGKRLFEILAQISGSVHQMLMLVDVPQFKDEVILLKASLSHAVTALRYNAVYHSILPKITVQAALSDLAFAICSLIDSTKIKVEQTKDNIPNLKVSKESEADLAVAPHTPIEPSFGSRLSQESFNKPKDLLDVSEETIDEMSPVKPLKITQRANISPNSNLKPSSSRKTSGSLLFSSMIETKSPLSSSHSNKAYSRQSQGITDDASEANSKRSVAYDSSVKDDQNPTEKEAQLSQEMAPATPTKSVNNANVKVINDTPSLPTPVASSAESVQKQVTVKPSPSTEDRQKADEEATHSTKSTEAVDANLVSLNKSFEDKLKTFANNTGIGLRVDEQTDNKPGEGTDQVDIQENTAKHNSPTKTQPFSTTVDSKRDEFSPNTKKVNYSPLRQQEANHTPSKLSERFKKTFDDMSENDSEDDSTSDLNDSSNFSDDPSTYMALKQSLRQNDSNKQEARTVTKATVYSPRAQQNSQFNDSETRFGSDTDLSDVATDFIPEKQEGEVRQMPPQDFRSAKPESDVSSVSKKRSESIANANKSKSPFAPDLEASVVKQEDFDDSSDYQFVPLTKKESIENEPLQREESSNRATQEDDEEEAESEVNFDFDAFDIENPDNTLSELLLYLEHQTVQVISTIQSLLTSIKQPKATKGDLRKESNAINKVIRQMVDATSISMNQSRNASLKEHGSWVVKSLEDCSLRMITLCELNAEGTFIDMKKDTDFADKHFKQRLAGIAFDVAKCTKELVKTVEEASLKEEIAFLNSRLI